MGVITLWRIFLLGFSSGLPFLLILATFSMWLAEVGVSKTQIGLLAWVTIPYTLKFLWAPFVDNRKIPWLSSILGQRRSWMLCAQVGLMLALIGMATTDPGVNILYTALWALAVGLFSAIQDITVEAYRIEILPPDKLGLGASMSVLGYRVGMLCSGAGAICLAALSQNWQLVYLVMSAFMLVGIITTMYSQEPSYHGQGSIKNTGKISSKRPASSKQAVKNLIADKSWLVIVIFIISYKCADTVLNVMSMPFLLEIGFNKLEIASVAKSFGIGAMVLGGCAGGLLLSKQSLRNSLLLCIILQMLASVLFFVQACVGYNVELLFLTMGVENFTCGMCQVALIAYFSKLCRAPYTAMHYAIISSFASFVRVNISSGAGWVADQLPWPNFYLLVSFSCIPSFIILLMYNKLSIVEPESGVVNAN